MPQRELSLKEHFRRFNAYSETSSDGEAAEYLGITRGAFRQWRNGVGLRGKGTSAHGLTRAEERRRRDAYRDTSTDQQAAAALDMPKSQFSSWRQMRGLPGKSRTWRTTSDQEEARRRQAYDAGLSDEEMAVALKLAATTIRMWRVRNNLPANQR